MNLSYCMNGHYLHLVLVIIVYNKTVNVKVLWIEYAKTIRIKFKSSSIVHAYTGYVNRNNWNAWTWNKRIQRVGRLVKNTIKTQGDVIKTKWRIVDRDT